MNFVGLFSRSVKLKSINQYTRRYIYKYVGIHIHIYSVVEITINILCLLANLLYEYYQKDINLRVYYPFLTPNISF